MPETFAQQLAAMTCAARADALCERDRAALRTSIADTVGCALGASRIAGAPDADRLAAAFAEAGPVPVIGGVRTAAAGAAAFANVALARYLDFNDTCIGRRNPAHPSDTLLGLWGLAAQHGASGAALADGVVAAYATIAWLCDHCDLLGGGWDTVTPLALAATAGASRTLALDRDRTSHALAIAAVDNVTLFETRLGQISDWKALASASAVRKGIAAAQLAAAGVTGPAAAFEGRNGLFAQLRAAPDVDRVDPDAWRQAFTSIHLKSAPVQYFAQGAVEIGIRIRALTDTPEAIAAIRVHANAVLFRGTASDRSRWRPITRETADHSLPFCLAVAVLEQRLGLEHFTQEVFARPALHRMMDRIEVVHDPALDARYPDALDVVAAVRMTDGRCFEERVEHPLGHVRRPMSAAQVRAKFASLVGSGEAEAWALATGLIDQPEVMTPLVRLGGHRR